MKKYAIVFPGQGSQTSGMGKDLYDSSEAARKVFETADRVLGYSISDLCFNGTDADITKTINAQPCILTVSIAAFEALKEKANFEIACTAGHSLGEYSALYASGAVDLETILKLIQKRAFLMNEAAESSNGSMAAVIGLSDEAVIDVTNKLDNVYVANFNSPGQVVITGGKNEIEASLDIYKSAGAKRVLPLAVSGAFHSPLMKSASDKFVDFVNQFKFKDSLYPVYTNVDAMETIYGEDFRKKLPSQIYSSVLWTQIINNIYLNGISNFIEIGPGKVLAGLNKKINSELVTYNVYNVESLELVVSELTNNKEKELV